MPASPQDLHIGEFVLSNELVSMTLAMVSENRDVNTLLRELFTPAGNELYVLPAARYLRCATCHCLLAVCQSSGRSRARSAPASVTALGARCSFCSVG